MIPNTSIHPLEVKAPMQGAYVLRNWRDYEDGPYRFMLKSVKTHECEMFHDMTSLLARLQDMLADGGTSADFVSCLF